MDKASQSKEQADLVEAYAAFQGGDFARVWRLYEASPPLKRTLPEWQGLVGASLCRQGQYRTAESFLNEAIANNPNDFDALTWLALINAPLGDGQVAVEYAQRAIQIRPHDATGQSVLGQVHLRQYHAELALAPLREATRLDPNSAIHWHNLAQ